MKRNKTIQAIRQIMFLSLLGLTFISCKKEDGNNDVPPATDYHQTAKTQFIDAGGSSYAYRVLGDKTGTPLIMLSALGTSMDDWDPAITNGLAQKFKVIIFDNRGVASSKGTTPDNIKDMAKQATEFIRALGYNKVNLMGFSMGGFVTQQIALTAPGLVDKIILTGTGPKGSIGLSNLPNLLASAANLTPKDAFLKFAFTSSAASLAAGKLSYERAQKRIVNRDLALTNETAGAQLTAVLGWAQADPNALNELKSIKSPVLIVHGHDDLPVAVINAENLSENIPDAHLFVYADAGHAAMFQNPELFIKQAVDFLSK